MFYVLVHFFPTVIHFHPSGCQHFSFSHCYYKISCCSSNKKCLLCFFYLTLDLFLVELRWLSAAIHFPAKIIWHLASAYMDWVYGWSAFVCYVITKFSCFHRLQIYLSNGAPPRALRVRELSYQKTNLVWQDDKTIIIIELFIAKYRDLSMSRRSIICRSRIIDLFATDKTQYFAQPHPKTVNYFLTNHLPGTLDFTVYCIAWARINLP